MKLTKIVYHRLYHIACFIPDQIFPDEQKKSNLCNNEPIYCNENMQALFKESMKISEEEYQLFCLCVIIFNRLNNLFKQYVEKSSLYPDKPKLFLQYIEENSDLSRAEINQESFGMFNSLRSCVDFYCKFSNIYYLFNTFFQIKIYKEKLPVLKYIRNDFFSMMQAYPLEVIPSLNVDCSNLQQKVTNFLNLNKDYEEKKSIYEVISDFTPVMVEMLDIVKLINENTRGDYISRHKQEVNKKRRESISQALRATEAWQNRAKYIGKIKETIREKVNKNKISLKAACQQFFTEHKDELKKWNITSCRTLQNYFSVVDPNKQRKAFKEIGVDPPKYAYGFWQAVKTVWENFNEHNDLQNYFKNYYSL